MFDALTSSKTSPVDIPFPDVAAVVDILVRYNRSFRTQRAETAEMIQMAQKIRYQVYCLERRFETAAEHRDGLETDSFDAMAVHSLLFHRTASDPIGTARLIVPGYAASGLPIQQLLHESGLRIEDHVPLESVAEVSRFSISHQFRRRCGEGHSMNDTNRDKELSGVLPCLGLLQDLLRHSIALGLTHWAAVMEPKLLRMLAAMGIHTTPVGPLVSYHGLRQPCYCRISAMLERLRHERPEHWLVLTDGGELTPADAAYRPTQRMAA